MLKKSSRVDVKVQVPMPADLYSAARRHAEGLGLSLATWIRYVVKQQLTLPVVDAWAAESQPTAGEIATWEGHAVGHYKLDLIAPPMFGHMSARVRENRGGGRGFSEPLSVGGLDAGSVFGVRDVRKRIIYVRGGTYWEVENRIEYSGAAVVTLKLIGSQHPDANKK